MKLSKYLTSMPEYVPSPNTYKIKLSTNESPYDLPDDIRAEIMEEWQKIPFNRYPDGRAVELRKAAAAYYGVGLENIMASNGSGEWLKLISEDLMEPGSKMMYLDPDFFIYYRNAGFTSGETVKVKKGENGFITLEDFIAAIKREKPDYLQFSNPCNPTGQGFTVEEVKQIVEACGDAVVIVDEAYNDFYGETYMHEAVKTDNVIVLRTCSKAIGLGGIRIGFAVACPKMIGYLTNIKSPYTVGRPAQIVGKVVFQHADYLREITNKIIADRDATYEKLEALAAKYPDKMITIPSKSNAWFIRFSDSKAVVDELHARDIDVRDFPKSWIPHTRINVGTPEENDALVAGIAAALEKM